MEEWCCLYKIDQIGALLGCGINESLLTCKKKENLYNVPVFYETEKLINFFKSQKVKKKLKLLKLS